MPVLGDTVSSALHITYAANFACLNAYSQCIFSPVLTRFAKNGALLLIQAAFFARFHTAGLFAVGRTEA